MKQGTSLEQEVFRTVNRLIENGRFPFQAAQCKVFLNKKYYSKDRDGDLETDVSVEVYIGEASEPFLIWVWECKDYGKGISVDELEEFHAKLEQIGADNTKGTMITSRGYYQAGSIKYAKAKKIGLARLLPDDQVHFVAFHGTPDTLQSLFAGDNILPALTEKYYISELGRSFVLDDDKFHSLEEYIFHVAKTWKREKDNPTEK